MYSTYNEGKSAVAERFIKTLKNKIYKHMTAVSKNVYFDVLNDIIDKYNNTFHRTIGMKPINVESNSYAKYNVDSDEKDPKFIVGDYVFILYFSCWYFKFCYKKNLGYLKTEVDKLDIDKLVRALVDLSKLSDVVKNDVVKKLCMIN